MPRPPRADEAGGLYHALNRGNLRADIFKQEVDFVGFEQILFEGPGHVYQQRYKSFPVQNAEHFFVACRYVERNAVRAGIVRRAEDWRWGSLWRWLQKTEPDPRLLSPWPRPRLPNWVGPLVPTLVPTRYKLSHLSAFPCPTDARLRDPRTSSAFAVTGSPDTKKPPLTSPVNGGFRVEDRGILRTRHKC